MANYSARSKSFAAKIFYTPKGQAQITIPAPLVKLFAKPCEATFYVQDGRVIIKFAEPAKNDGQMKQGAVNS
ncbi:hypothetical protein [Candidatus Nitrososphaera sp. FF02]|uniref:hypothetical protein n=1 Tax=Candidatus Nitrososphaera sp. FF02 TaxID=3398226 RepID=UPI0039EC01AE